MLWVQFFVCAGLVVAVGSLLSRYADILAEKTGLGRGWVGLVLLAGATSLPEMTTGISAVTLVGDVNLAAGGALGSCLFNLLLLALFDAACGPEPLLRQAQVSHILAASIGGLLLTLVVASLFVTQTVGLPPLGWVGLPSLLLIATYLVSVRVVFQFEKRRLAEVLEQEAEVYQYGAISLRRAITVFALLAVAIAGLGIWLAVLGDRIIAATGLGSSFVGAIFLAITTSLPEIVAGLTAVRLGAVDLAVSNIFGANLINCAALGVYDLLLLRRVVWEEMAPVHGFTAATAAAMTALATAGLIYRATRKARGQISWTSLPLILLYVGGMYVLYTVTR